MTISNLNHFDTTICAPATIPGTGAISVIRVSGRDAAAISGRIIDCRKGNISEAGGYTLHLGSIHDKSGNLLDEVLVSVFRAPHSYTGEDSVEISCHASSFIVSGIISLLLEEGCTMAQPGEFTQRAFINGKMDLSQAEAVSDLIRSTSSASHKVAVSQLKGGISRELSLLRGKMLEATALMELELDFDQEDVEFADRSYVKTLVETISSQCRTLADTFRQGNAVRNGIPTVIVGEPNSGKSTLLNALVGEQRAIVSDIPGTTRDTIEETAVIGGMTFRFIDTAGIRETDETIEKLGIERTLDMISKASLVMLTVDITKGPDAVSNAVDNVIRDMDMSGKHFIILRNKTDLAPSLLDACVQNIDGNTDALNPSMSDSGQDGFRKRNCVNAEGMTVLNISAKDGTGLDRLKDVLSECGERICGLGDSEGVLLTSARHYEALMNTLSSLERVLDGIDGGIPADLLSQDLREAVYHLGTITGEITTDEVLGEIFSKFCIGK